MSIKIIESGKSVLYSVDSTASQQPAVCNCKTLKTLAMTLHLHFTVTTCTI